MEDEFVLAGVEQEVMEAFPKEASLELRLENKQAFLSRRSNMSSQGHRGWEQLASCWRKLRHWARGWGGLEKEAGEGSQAQIMP